jgi:hypothetical protein
MRGGCIDAHTARLPDWLVHGQLPYAFVPGGFFVPKPSRNVGCQRCLISDLGATVRQCPLAFTAGGGGCYSLGYLPLAHAERFDRMPNSDQVYESDWLSAVASERWRLWSLPSRLPSEISHWTYTDAAACCSCASLGCEASDARIADPGVPHAVR